MPAKARQNVPDALFRHATTICAVLVLLLMVGFFLELVYHSAPSIRRFGIGFLFSSEWDPVKERFGALSSVYGTLVTTVIALVIAVPASFATALYLVELSPPWISSILSQCLDLLAAIPSIIYGMWGLYVFVPIMQRHIQPFLADTLQLKVLPFFRDPASGFNVLTAGLVLALMVLPFISAVMRDVFKMVPAVVKESAYGMGATTWEVTFDVTMKYGMQGLLGAVFLGLGRAIGETMAVLFIIGCSARVSWSLFAPGNTIASALADDFPEADGIQRSALFELALILLCMTFLIQVVAQIWLNKVRKRAGGGL